MQTNRLPEEFLNIPPLPPLRPCNAGSKLNQDVSDQPGERAGLPNEMRIRLGHALIERVAQEHNVQLLHIKGYSVDDGLYEKGRASSDIDILIHPNHVTNFVGALQMRGWTTVTRFTTGSVFQHAMTLWHVTWGYVDLHRSFPGVEMPAAEFFEDLWRSKTSRLIADVACAVPQAHHQALLIVLHAARDPQRGPSDVRHLRGIIPPEDWDALRLKAQRCGAGLAFAAATGALADFENHPAHDLWAVVSAGGSRTELLQARARAADSFWGRTRVLLSGVFANRDHLRMTLKREPRPMDYLKEILGRFVEVWRLLTARLSK